MLVKKMPFIHLFASINNYYLLDVNTNEILQVSSKAYEYLELCQSNNKLLETTIDVQEELDNLFENGYLLSHKVTDIQHYGTEFVDVF